MPAATAAAAACWTSVALATLAAATCCTASLPPSCLPAQLCRRFPRLSVVAKRIAAICSSFFTLNCIVAPPRAAPKLLLLLPRSCSKSGALLFIFSLSVPACPPASQPVHQSSCPVYPVFPVSLRACNPAYLPLTAIKRSAQRLPVPHLVPHRVFYVFLIYESTNCP